jgi:hypothetical protein
MFLTSRNTNFAARESPCGTQLAYTGLVKLKISESYSCHSRYFNIDPYVGQLCNMCFPWAAEGAGILEEVSCESTYTV